MSDVIHFHCPACGASLSVPTASAGLRGPCPLCAAEIVSPDPNLGLPARRHLQGPSSRDTDLFNPFAEGSPEPKPEPTRAPASAREIETTQTPAITLPPPVPAEPPRPRQRVLLRSCLLAAIIGLIAGYLIGLRNQPPALPPREIPAPETPAPETPTPETPTPETPAPETPAPETPAPETPAPETPAPEAPAPETPESTLQSFLSAPDPTTRAKHVLFPQSVLPKIEAYHATEPDQATVPLWLRRNGSNDALESGEPLATYLVATQGIPDGFPVAVVQTPDGWKVDWESFVEFRDDHFGRFARGQGGDTGAFHLLVRNTHYFGPPFAGSDRLTAFRVDPPLPERTQYAFVATGSELHKNLASSTEWGRPCAPVLQLVRVTHEDGTTHLEITGILSPDWRPRP